MIYGLRTTHLDLNLNHRWCRRRWIYRLALAVIFVAIAFYFGPNRILWGRWTPLSTADFVAPVQQRCAPVVKAMLSFQRDHGRRAMGVADIVPAYIASVPNGTDIADGEITFRGMLVGNAFDRYHAVTYSFNRLTEGWWG